MFELGSYCVRHFTKIYCYISTEFAYFSSGALVARPRLITHTAETGPFSRLSFLSSAILPGSNFFGKTPLFFRYSGVNAANAVNLQAKRR